MNFITKKFLSFVCFSVIAIFSASAENEVTTILSENFNAFTEGSVETPGTDDIANYKSGRLAALLPGWAGRNVNEAGGCLFIQGSSSNYLQTTKINTSANNGIFKISFRVKAAASYGNMISCQVGYNTAINVVVDNDEWQSVSVISEKGSSYSYVKFFSMLDGFYIDDLVIESSDSFIASPQAKSPQDYNFESFTASWTKCASTTEYVVSVYNKDLDGNKTNLVEQRVAAPALKQAITGLDASKVYYYSVRAENATARSEESNEIKLQEIITSLDAPVATEATNVSATSFVANWNSVNKADSYIVKLIECDKLTASKTVSILAEDFSGITTGTTTGVDFPTTTFEYLDRFTSTPGWSAYCHAYAKGYIALAPYTSPATLLTPEINLSGANGVCTVSFNAFANTTGQEMKVSLMDGDSEVETKTIAIGTESTKYDVTFNNGKANSQILFSYTASSPNKVFIDDVNVEQSLNAGDTYEQTKSETETTETSYAFENLTFSDNISYKYIVYASVETIDTAGDDVTVTSAASNDITVSFTSGVENVAASSIKAYATSEGVAVELPQDATINVYNANGAIVARVNGVAGVNNIATDARFVIVSTLGKAIKVAK